MKRLLTYLLLCSICLVSCQQDPDFGTEMKLIIENEQLKPSYTSIDVECQFTTNATIKEVYAQYAPTEDFKDYLETKLLEKSKKYSTTIGGLQDNTTYYIRYAVRNNYSTVITEYSSAKTHEQLLAEIKTTPASNVSYTSATVGGKIVSDGGAEVTERGVVYSTQSNPIIANNKVVVGKGTGEFTTTLSNLTDGNTYYVRAYATNRKGTNYGEQISLTTKKFAAPSITTTAVSNVAYTSATVGGDVTSDGGAEVTERGVVYSTSTNPTTANTKKVSGKGLGSFSITLNSLSDGVSYYVRAYAVNKFGTSYGEQVCFTTSGYQLPIVQTTTPTNVEYTSATLGGKVTSEGNASVTERGVVYSTRPNPTTDNTQYRSGTGLGSYSINVSNLKDGTTYYVRAYAINVKGITYGTEVSFTTKGYALPNVETTSVSNVSYSTAIVSGNVTSEGDPKATERGIVYSTSPNPTTSNSKIIVGSGIGSFSANLNTLANGTTYYTRAYAINSGGTSYGKELSFTTKAYTAPHVTTTKISKITYTSASSGGNITSDGGSSVTERGIVYSTSPNPTTTSSTKRVAGKGVGSFDVDLMNLWSGTTYYVRAYAINSNGTSYGEEISFTTNQYSLPKTEIKSISNISYLSVDIEANIISDGGKSVTEVGIVYSTSPNPTTTNALIQHAANQETFSVTLTNLTNGTKYYVRSYAKNSVGIAYSQVKEFTTLQYEYIDLGLSVKWAKCNVGRIHPQEGGSYYPWGEISIYSNYTYGWTFYRWCKGSEHSLTKYNTDSAYGTVDNKTTLDPEDDTATANWGGDWRMPTQKEFEELKNNCSFNYEYGSWGSGTYSGIRIRSNIPGYTDNSIFIPFGSYWSSTLCTSKPSYAYCALINSNGFSTSGIKTRENAVFIRPVCP